MAKKWEQFKIVLFFMDHPVSDISDTMVCISDISDLVINGNNSHFVMLLIFDTDAYSCNGESNFETEIITNIFFYLGISTLIGRN